MTETTSRTPWLAVVGVYLGARLVSAGLLLLMATGQGGNRWWPDGAPPLDVLLAHWWDAVWYGEIAATGYPGELPTLDDGSVQINHWAFFPAYPLLVRGLMALTGGTWAVVAPLTALVLGAVAMLAVARVTELGAPRAVAAHPGLPLATVALLATAPASVVFGVAYTESLALLGIAVTLLLILRRRYLLAVPVVVVIGLTRAVALPLLVVVLAHAAMRWRAARRGGDHLTIPDAAALALLALTSGVAGLAWPAIVGRLTGVPDAYLQTQAAWRSGRSATPFGGWERLGELPLWQGALALASVAGVVVLLLCPAGRRLGTELWWWSAAYAGYLVAVSDLISSLFRFLLLAFPLATVVVGLVPQPSRRARAWLIALVVLGVALQVVWVWEVWAYDGGETDFLRTP